MSSNSPTTNANLKPNQKTTFKDKVPMFMDWVKNGMTVQQIAKKYNISTNMASKYMRDMQKHLYHPNRVSRMSEYVDHPAQEKMAQDRNKVMKQMGLNENDLDENDKSELSQKSTLSPSQDKNKELRKINK